MSKPSWNLNVKSLSHQKLVEILTELKDTPYVELVRDLRKELVDRLRARGMNTPEIVRRLSFSVPRGIELSEVASDWAESLEITPAEFKRIADGK
jgi:hypothetical protein